MIMTEREILEVSIKAHQAGIDEARKQLVTLDEPKLTEGDYGYNKLGENGRYLDARIFCNNHSWGYIGKSNCDYAPLKVITGNIWEDLRRNNQYLKQFNLDVNDYKFDFDLCPHAPIYIAGNWHTLDKAGKFHQDFGRMLAAAIRYSKSKQNS